MSHDLYTSRPHNSTQSKGWFDIQATCILGSPFTPVIYFYASLEPTMVVL